MIHQIPSWINPPSYMVRQTDIFRKWHAIMLEHTIQDPPPFLRHLSPVEIRKALEMTARTTPSPTIESTPFLIQIRVYKRQLELIGWSYFIMLGEELNHLQNKLSKQEFEKLIVAIGMSADEAKLSMLAAQQEARAF